VPQVRQGVPGPKTTGEAQQSLSLNGSQTPPVLLSNREFPVNLRTCLLTASLTLPLPHARAQATPAPSSATFDVVSIHENNTATDGHHHIYNNPSESHFRTVNLSLKDLIQFAYDLPKSQIIAGPPWLDSTMFDIDAKSDPSIDAELQALPADQARHRRAAQNSSLPRQTAPPSTPAAPACTSPAPTTPSPFSRASSPRSSAASFSTTQESPADTTSPSNGPPTMRDHLIPTCRPASSPQSRNSSA
jgi:hypothetical protein